jgi:hypothetical protein
MRSLEAHNLDSPEASCEQIQESQNGNWCVRDLLSSYLKEKCLLHLNVLGHGVKTGKVKSLDSQ